MRTLLGISMALCLAACGGGGPGASANQEAANACRAETDSRLAGKLYEMDTAALAASAKDAPNGEKFLTAPITIEPGLTSEVKQIVECTVRFNEGSATPDVVGFGFNW